MSRSPKCRVLIVEDDLLVARLLGDMVLDLGTEVVGPIDSVDEALRLAGSEPLDVATLDIFVDGEASYPVADALLMRAVPVIFTTGYAPVDLPERFKDIPLLAKPFWYDDLASALKEALEDAPCTIQPDEAGQTRLLLRGWWPWPTPPPELIEPTERPS